MTDLAKLTRKRGNIKGQLTRLETFIQNYDSSKHHEISIRLKRAEAWWDEFESIQDEIEDLDNSDEQVAERDDFGTKYFDILGRLNLLAHGGSTQDSTAPRTEVRLPPMEVPNFYGSYKQWLEFHDSFKSLVDSNLSLTNIQKFYYLKGALKGTAADVIHSLEVSSENYQVAWDLLKERFENKKLIALSHIDSICNVPGLTKESHSGLRKMLDELRKDLRALKTLGLGVEHWDPILIYLLESKLDPITRKEWQKQGSVDKFATMDDFFKFLVNKCAVWETNIRSSNTDDQGKGKPHLPPPRSTTKTFSCILCKADEHCLQQCKQFLDLSLEDKRRVVSRSNACWKCLKLGHRVHACTSGGCRRCKGKHHLLLHDNQHTGKETRDSKEGAAEGGGSKVFNGHSSEDKGLEMQGVKKEITEVLLSTAVVRVKDIEGKWHECRALLDCGSQSSFVTKAFRDILRLPMKRINSSIMGIGPETMSIDHSVVARIYSTHSQYNADVGFLVIDEISNNIPSVSIDLKSLNLPENIKLADPSCGEPGKIDMLLGASVFWSVLGTEKVELGKGKPLLHGTKLGFVIAGTMHLKPGQMQVHKQSQPKRCHFSSNCSVQGQLEKFWALEEIGYEKRLTREEEECERFFAETTKRSEDGRFVVKLPIRVGVPELGNSVNLAIKRFSSLEKKIERDNELKEMYHAFIREYLSLGHMSRVYSDKEMNEPVAYYLPHHAVIKKTSLTTKLRVVFDASAPTNTGVSLNNQLMVGPKLQDDIFDILVRLRKYAVIITADVEKMFRQVWVAEEDQDLQRILWRFNPDEPIGHFKLNTITYGMACSGYLAVKCLQQLSECEDDKVGRAIMKDFYMDDLLTGADTVEEAREIKKGISQVLASGGFILRKWSSNKPETLLTCDEPNVEHYISGDSTSKTLGIRWNPHLDTLHYDCPEDYGVLLDNKVTKRIILSLISQIFDPLGLLAPVIIKAKLVLQLLWKEKVGWDEEVPQGVLVPWLNLREEFQKLKVFQIERQVICTGSRDFQIHGFCDASQKAYGACIFVRSVDQKGDCHVRLLCSKSRVAPLKVISLPRLELCGALLLAKLVKAVLQAIDINPSQIRYWSDSSIVLSWLSREPSTWTTFVANRVAEIQTLSGGNQWGHVPSEQNPADLVSRGTDCDSLSENLLWWEGPFWLSREENYFPQTHIPSVDVIPEQKIIKHSYIVTDLNKVLRRFSNFNKLLRTFSYCLRFMQNCRASKRGEPPRRGPLTVQELDKAWTVVIALVQREVFGAEIKAIEGGCGLDRRSRILSLNPFLDKDGLLRVGGRLAKANLSYNQRFPVILPNKHDVTRLIILCEHYKHLHAGPQALLAVMRLKYWPILGRQTIRSVLSRCIVCFRAKPKDFRQYMGELPSSRIVPSRPFENCGVDYAGPFFVKSGTVRKPVITKAYLCVFICFATKAVHLELVVDLTTQAFLNCFKRFIARRGLCRNVYSDNATNFIGANNELTELSRFLQDKGNQEVFSQYFTNSFIKWHFIPPRSPHFGGLWESAVKSAKYHLKRVLNDQKLTFEELYTVITQVEACLNSRPITPVSESADDLEILTPGHFLMGSSPSALPQEDIKGHNPNRLQRYKLLTQFIQSFWKRWQTEYLGNLQQRSKWRIRADSIKINDMVLVKEDNTPPMKWQLGRVVELHTGSDGICRVVSLKTASGLIKRSTSRVCVLPFEGSN